MTDAREEPVPVPPSAEPPPPPPGAPVETPPASAPPPPSVPPEVAAAPPPPVEPAPVASPPPASPPPPVVTVERSPWTPGGPPPGRPTGPLLTGLPPRTEIPKERAPWPIVTAILWLLVLAMAYEYHRLGHVIFESARLSPELVKNPLGCWRLVAALFVHGPNQVFTCVSVLGMIAAGGWKSERSFGHGAALLVFLLGGAAGNLVRCLTESPEWLEHAGSSGLTGGVALGAAAVSAGVRLREPQSLRGLVRLIVGTSFTLFLCSLDAAGTDPLEVSRILLPGVLVGLVSGGILGALLPLHSRKPGVAVQAAILVVGLLLLSLGGVGYVRLLWPEIAPRTGPDGKVGPRAPRKDPDPWALVKTYDEKLGLEFGVPRAFRKFDLSEEYMKSVKGRAVAYHAFFGMPMFDLCAFPKGEFDSPDTVAIAIARGWCQQNPNVDYLPQGEGWIKDCPLGKAYRVALRDATQGQESALWIAVVTDGSTTARLTVRASLDDEQGSELLEALVRSLKVRTGKADK